MAISFLQFSVVFLCITIKANDKKKVEYLDLGSKMHA